MTPPGPGPTTLYCMAYCQHREHRLGAVAQLASWSRRREGCPGPVRELLDEVLR